MNFSTQELKHHLIMQPKNQEFYRKLTEEEAEVITTELICCLKIFDEICRSNGLVYLIVAGGLIGAVREGGLLPWDDDIDLVMPRDDYRKFKKALEKSKYKDDYCFKYPEDNSVITMGAHFFNKRRKLTDLVSESIEGSRIYENHSYLDIVPLDHCSDNMIVDKVKGILTNLIQIGYTSRRCFSKNDPFLGYLAKQSLPLRLNLLVRKAFAAIFLPIPKKVLFRQLDYILRSQKNTKAMTISYGAWRYFGEELPTEVFLPPRDMDFSGMTAMVPNDPDKYLTHRYGNYMKAPSQEERNTRMIKLREDWQKYIPKGE